MNVDYSYPQYCFSKQLLREIAGSIIKGEYRSIKNDSIVSIQGIKPPIHIIGRENIPSKGPALITMNHYSRKGFSIVWGAMAVAAQLPVNQIWMMTGAWTKRKPGWDKIRTSITAFIFSRLAEIYGAVTTPPLPAIQEEQQERSISILKLNRKIHNDPSAIVCISPEGRDYFEGELGTPPYGAGKFIHYLEKKIGKIIPVGICEYLGKLIVNFGQAYDLEKENFGESIDQSVSTIVMYKIAQLLPTRARRNYFLEE